MIDKTNWRRKKKPGELKMIYKALKFIILEPLKYETQLKQ